ncbi:MAG: hypothetical protein PVI53_16565, partial [Desulfobacteraceae bacterium]
WASSCPRARPIPEAAPVTIATLSLKFSMLHYSWLLEDLVFNGDGSPKRELNLPHQGLVESRSNARPE